MIPSEELKALGFPKVDNVSFLPVLVEDLPQQRRAKCNKSRQQAADGMLTQTTGE